MNSFKIVTLFSNYWIGISIYFLTWLPSIQIAPNPERNGVTVHYSSCTVCRLNTMLTIGQLEGLPTHWLSLLENIGPQLLNPRPPFGKSDYDSISRLPSLPMGRNSQEVPMLRWSDQSESIKIVLITWTGICSRVASENNIDEYTDGWLSLSGNV